MANYYNYPPKGNANKFKLYNGNTRWKKGHHNDHANAHYPMPSMLPGFTDFSTNDEGNFADHRPATPVFVGMNHQLEFDPQRDEMRDLVLSKMSDVMLAKCERWKQHLIEKGGDDHGTAPVMDLNTPQPRWNREQSNASEGDRIQDNRMITVFKSSTKWVRKPNPNPTDVSEANQEPTSSSTITDSTNILSSKALLDSASTSKSYSKRKPDLAAFSFRVINGRRIAGGSRECFKHIAGSCKAGVFCQYEHDGVQQQDVKICARLLRGACRPDDVCPCNHSIAAHQLPICQFFLRLECFKQNCSLLHVKYGDDESPCEEFNRGTCTKGDECSKPHRYLIGVVKNKGHFSESARPTTTEATTGSVGDADPDDGGLLTWIM